MAPFIPEPHWFVRPGVFSEHDPGLMNPTYDLLDYPIVMGRADETFMTAQNADGHSVDLTFQDALDRVAKLAGVLRLLGVGVSNPESADADTDADVDSVADADAGAEGRGDTVSDEPGADLNEPETPVSDVFIDTDLPRLAQELIRLAVFRIGGTVTDRRDAQVSLVPGAGPQAAPTAQGLSITQRKAVRRVPSHVEGVELQAPGLNAELDVLVRDGRIEPAPAVELSPKLTVQRTATSVLSAAAASQAKG